MFKTVSNRVWAFDAEWIPDPLAGKMLYKLGDGTPDSEVMQHMWQKGGATEEDPKPYLKTVMCRIVTVAAIERLVENGTTKLRLLSLPRDINDSNQIFIDTNNLNTIHPFGMDVFKKNLSVLDININNIIITGKHRFSLEQRKC